MTPEQEGAYIRLLCYQWNSDDQTIPSDDSELAVLSRLNGRWQECGKRIKACFDPVESEPTKLRNDRLWHEFCRIDGLRSKQAAGGRAAMAHRWAKEQVSNKSVISDLKDTNGLAPSLLSVSGTGIQEGMQEEKSKARPESIAAVKAYAAEIYLPVTEADKFYDFYSSKGWLVGKAAMKDWRAALRNWKRNASSATGTRAAQPDLINTYHQKEHTRHDAF